MAGQFGRIIGQSNGRAGRSNGRAGQTNGRAGQSNERTSQANERPPRSLTGLSNNDTEAPIDANSDNGDGALFTGATSTGATSTDATLTDGGFFGYGAEEEEGDDGWDLGWGDWDEFLPTPTFTGEE